MTLLDDAIIAYRSAARLLATLAEMRVDLVAEAGHALAREPALTVAGHRELSPRLDVVVAEGARARLRSLLPAEPALRIESDFPEWLSLEAWLPEDDGLESCIVELDLIAERPFGADLFLRSFAADGSATDTPPIDWKLTGRGLAVNELPLTPGAGVRRKLILLMRRPPAEVTLRDFAMVPL